MLSCGDRRKQEQESPIYNSGILGSPSNNARGLEQEPVNEYHSSSKVAMNALLNISILFRRYKQKNFCRTTEKNSS